MIEDRMGDLVEVSAQLKIPVMSRNQTNSANIICLIKQAVKICHHCGAKNNILSRPDLVNSFIPPNNSVRFIRMSMDLDGPVPFSGIEQDQPIATYAR